MMIIIGIPEFISGRAKILKVSMSFFSYIIYAAFSAVLFTYMTRTVFIPPFDSLDSLATDTDYNILTMKGSLGDIALQVLINTHLVIYVYCICILYYYFIYLRLF